MIRIAVISDTHLRHPTEDLKALMTGPFRDAEMILHAGDITELSVLGAFAGKKVLAVSGNMDSPEVRRQLPTQRVFQAGRFKIGLIHGWGTPGGIEERIAREFEKVDCIVYGHTHRPSQKEREGVLLFNPGAFGGDLSTNQRTVGLLNLNDTLAGQVIYL